jgi:hypothetical protein
LINEEILKKKENILNIPNYKIFFKKKNEFSDIEYYLYNICYYHFIKKNFKFLWVNKIINSDIIYKLYINLFTNDIFIYLKTIFNNKNYEYEENKIDNLFEYLNPDKSVVIMTLFDIESIKKTIKLYL